MVKLALSIAAAAILSIVILMTAMSAQAKPAHTALQSQNSSAGGTLNKNTSMVKNIPAIETDNETNNQSEASSDNIPAVVSPTATVVEQAPADTSALDHFVSSLKNQQAGRVVGVYVPSVLALKVVQQPANNPAYVNATAGYATQFGLAAQYGTTGFLAHNYLSGGLFFNLAVGEEVDVIYGDGAIRRYRIGSLRHFQALSPTSPASNFVDIDAHNNLQISNADLFDQIYNQGDQVVFQTCINANGNTSWGRLFVIAKPIQ